MSILTKRMEEVRALRARTDRHPNCAQSILVTFSDKLGLTKDQAFGLGMGFGRGMHFESTCGTLTAALMVLGMQGYDKEASASLVRDFTERYETTVCRELTAAIEARGLPRKAGCDRMVYEMVEALSRQLDGCGDLCAGTER